MSETKKRKFSTEYTLISSPVVKNLREELRRKSSIPLTTIPFDQNELKHRKKISIASEIYAKDELRKLAYEAPEGQIDKKTERKIRKQIPDKLAEKFPQIYDNLLKSVQEQYGKFIKNIAAEQKIPPEQTDSETYEIRDVTIYKPTYEIVEFHERKLWLERRLFVTTPLIRKIHYKSRTNYMKTLINFQSYRESSKSIQIAVLRAKIREDLESAKSKTIQELCTYTNALIKTKNYLKTIEYEFFTIFVPCIQKFLKLRIMEFLYRTIEHFIGTIQNSDQIPLIKFNLTITDEMDLMPNIAQVYQFYHSLVDIIGNHDIELQKLSYTATDQDFVKLKIEVPSYLFEWAHSEIDKYLTMLVEPLEKHLATLNETYNQFWNPEYHEELRNFYKTHTFEECCQKYADLQQHKSKVTQLFPYEYFEIGIVEQTDFIMSLLRRINICIDNVLNSLVENNFNIKKEICAEFLTISKKASKVPKSTQELVDMGTFMAHAKSERIGQLQQNIKITMLESVELLSITTIPEDHIKLNSKTMSWIQKIEQIVDKNTAMFEQRKNELEEELQRQIDELTKNVQHFANNLQILDDMSDCTKAGTYIYHLKVMHLEIQKFIEKQKWINHEESLFKFPPSNFPDLEECKDIIYTFSDLICQCHQWLRTYSVFMDGPWENLTYENVSQTVTQYRDTFTKYQKMYNAKIRQQITDGAPRRFKGQVDDPDFHNHPAPLKICANAIKYIKEFEPNIEIIRILCNPALLQRHWDEMSVVVGRDITPNAGTTLRKVVAEKLDEYLEQFDIISIAAMKELKLQQNLLAMQEQWGHIVFETVQWKATEFNILNNLEEIYAILDDHIIQTLNMRGSVFVKPVEKEVKAWYDYLLHLKTTIETWYNIQNNWLLIIPILTCEHITCELIQETEWFHQVDANLKTFLEKVQQVKIVRDIIDDENLNKELVESEKLLNKINIGLNNFIETKRLYFPRFFFLSDNDILQILSFTKYIEKLLPFINKCFKTVHNFELKNNTIVTVSSEMGELVKLLKPVNVVTNNVWQIFAELEKQIRETIKDDIYKANQDHYFIPRQKWLQKWTQQVILIVSKMKWTTECEASIQKDPKYALKNYLKDLNQQLTETVTFMDSKKVTSNLTKHMLVALYAQTLHNRAIVEYLRQNETSNLDSFHWSVQFRYYWDATVRVRIFRFEKDYMYEYLGNEQRLIQTPNTERCYRAFIAATQFQLNGCIESAEISGKTETFMDLAKIFAAPYVVYNCRADIRYETVLRFIKGTIACGSYFCFDDFNCMKLGILSVLAQFMTDIAHAIRLKKEAVLILDTEIQLKPSCFLGVTLSYKGDITILPNNLKVLFRSFYLAIPDRKIVIEATLAQYGFKNFQSLSRKLLMLYDYFAEMFQVKKYDFHIRNLKKILLAAGEQRLENPTANEYTLLLREILKFIFPQIESVDIPRFQNLVKDIFPDVEFSMNVNGEIMDTIAEICKRDKIELNENFQAKLIELYCQLKSNFGIILTGEPFSGKSTALKILQEVQNTRENKSINYYVLNPKTLSSDVIFGKLKETAGYGSGIHGICPKIYQQKYIENDYNGEDWIIFDGPVENFWFNFLYSALDNSNQMYLQSSEVIPRPPTLQIIFETSDINHVSPNIISRCGVICFSTVSWETVLNCWLLDKNPLWSVKATSIMPPLLKWIVPPCLKYIHEQCVCVLFPGQTNLVRSTLLLTGMILEDATTENLEDVKYVTSWIQATFYICFIWNISSLLDQNDLIKFDEFYKNLWRGQIEEHRQPADVEKLDFALPIEGLSIDYFYIFKIKGGWKYWPDIIRSPKIEDINLNRMIVPTVNSARQTYLLELHTRYKHNFILIGDSGCGKTCYIDNLLNNKLPKNCEKAAIQLTRKMSGYDAQTLFLSKFSKHKTNRYGASEGKTMVCFIDDIHLCLKDEFKNQPPIELLRQYLDYGFWHDEHQNKIFLSDILFVCASGFIGGKCPKICQRFLQHFSIYLLPALTDESLQKIFCCKLFHSFKSNGFPTDVMASVQSIVQGTIQIFNQVLEKLKPIPAKSTYIFQLKDFEKVINGCAILKKESVAHKKVFARLWIHEMLRVFSDRLSDSTEKTWLQEQLNECLSQHFKEDFDSLFDRYESINNCDKQDILEHLYYSSIQNENRRYEEIVSTGEVEKIGSLELERYNTKNNLKLNLVLQHYSLKHLIRVCRAFSHPGGSMLLIGSNGSGRESLVRLAASIFNYDLFMLKTRPNYNFNDWRDDIKQVLLQTGGHGKKTVLLIKEYHLKNKDCLDDLNSLLTLGEIQNMYTVEEMQTVLEATRVAAQQGNRSLDVTVPKIMQFYINRCQQNLHIVICLSPSSKLLNSRLRLYPALTGVCTLNRFEEWPSLMYEKISERFIAILSLPPQHKELLPNACRIFNTTIKNMSKIIGNKTNRYNYITSAAFIDFLRCYQSLMDKKQKEIMEARHKYQTGLDKLSYATEQVVLLQDELSTLKPQLMQMGERAAEMRKVIEHETIAVEKASQLVREEEKIANAQAAAAQSLKSECEADLALAIPILEDAISALNTLKPTDITLVKSMKNPPDTIKLVMAAVCVIKEIKPDRLPDAATGKKIIDYWGPSKRILGEMNFLQQLKEFDKDNIPPAVMQKIRKEYLPNKDFQPHIVAKASSAAEGLCKWVIAMDLYDKVAKEVAPKKAKLVIAETKYANTLTILNEKRRKFSELKERLESLNKQLAEANRDMKRVQDEVDNCTRKYQCAQKLVNSLEFEKSYWTETVNSLKKAYDFLTGDILFSASIIAYMGPFSWKNRELIFAELKQPLIDLKIPFSEKFNFARLLKEKSNQKNAQEFIDYSMRNITTDNTTIIQNSKRRCLLVDPQLQMFNWIQKLEDGNKLKIIKITEPNILDELISSAAIGTPVIITNIQLEIDVSLIPFLTQRIYERDNQTYLVTNTTDIPYNRNFRLYLITTLPNPQYTEQITHNVNIIYCPITKFTLSDKLLEILIYKEDNELYLKRKQILMEASKYKIKLKNIRYNILKTLSESKTNILDDEMAIETLDNSKITLNITQNEQREANTLLSSLEETIKNYRPISAYAATMYRFLLSLYNLNYMYQYSLKWYTNLFEISIAKAPRSKILEERIKNLIDYFAKTLFKNISQSLFIRDSLIFSFMLYLQTIMLQNRVKSELVDFFIREQFPPQPISDVESPEKPEWIHSNELWRKLVYLNSTVEFGGIIESFSNSSDEWRRFYTNRSPNDVPENWNGKKLTAFEKLIIVKLFLPEQTLRFLKIVISEELGEYFIKPPLYSIEKTYQASSGSNVIVLLTTPYVIDPTLSLKKFAQKMGLTSNFQIICFGTDQQIAVAEQLIEQHQKYEYWICIQNLHLAPQWMPKLEKICENFHSDNTSTNFRLWLITDQSENFPSYVLQNCTKVTIDMQEGLKETLISCYESDSIKDPNFYQQCPGYDKMFHRAIYSICFFHAILREREDFGHIAWTYPMTFDNYDLQLSLDQLAVYVQQYKDIPFKFLQYLIASCNYGGKAIDIWDQRCLETIFQNLFNESIIQNDLYSFLDHKVEYRVPRKLEYFHVLQHINKMPEIQPPEILGLNQNDEFTRNCERLQQFMAHICLVKNYPRSIKLDDQKILDTIKNILEKLLPKSTLIKEILNKYRATYLENIFDDLIYSEISYFEILFTQMQIDLVELEKSLSGAITISPYLNELFLKMDENLVPKQWLHVAMNSKRTTLGQFIHDLITRFEFFENWHAENIQTPKTFYLPAFFLPRKLFFTFILDHSKTNSLPLENIKLNFSVSKSDGNFYNIEGLHIIGAAWNEFDHTLDVVQFGDIFQKMPPITVQVATDEHLDEKITYMCPLFKTRLKNYQQNLNFIWQIPLRSIQKSPTYWAKRNTFLVCRP